jgi:hypothetical protein
MRIEGRVRAVLINVETGETEQDEEFNTLLDPIEDWAAGVVAAELFAANAGIAVGTGEDIGYNITNRDAFFTLGATYVTGAQGVGVTSQVIREVLIAMKRVGDVGAATLNLTIEGVSGGSPNGTPITNGTSANIAGAVIPTADFDWVSFNFSPGFDLNAAGFIKINTTGYTYSAGVTEIQVGYDASSAAYAGGELRVYNGSSWISHPTPGDMVFRAVRNTDPLIQTMATATLDLNQLVSVGAVGNEVRLLAQFGVDEANDRIREMFLLPALSLSDQPLAVAAISVNKTSTHVLQCYWLLRFSIDPALP